MPGICNPPRLARYKSQKPGSFRKQCFIETYFAKQSLDVIFEVTHMKKTTFTLILFFGTLLVSCFEKQECPSVKPYFKIKAMVPYNLGFLNSGPNQWAVLNEQDSIAWDKYFVRVGFEADYVAGNVPSSRFTGGQSLFALDCNVNGYKGSGVGVKRIDFIALSDYNTNYAKNDTLNDVVKMYDWTFSVNDLPLYYPIQDFVKMYSNNLYRQNFEFRITEPPSENSKEAQFKIVLELRDGQKFEAETKKIRLLR
jgi:hypothetical protein